MSDPFCWQAKSIRRLIRQQCEDPGTALAVYDALTEVASDKESETFQTTHAYLAGLCGFTDRTVRRRLEDLQRIGAVEVQTPDLRAPCTYTLLTIGHKVRTFGNGVRALGHKSTLAVSDIRTLEHKKVPEQGKPKTVSERIGLETQKKILEKRLEELKADTSEQWQRDQHPELLEEKRTVASKLKDIEDRLLA